MPVCAPLSLLTLLNDSIYSINWSMLMTTTHNDPHTELDQTVAARRAEEAKKTLALLGRLAPRGDVLAVEPVEDPYTGNLIVPTGPSKDKEPPSFAVVRIVGSLVNERFKDRGFPIDVAVGDRIVYQQGFLTKVGTARITLVPCEQVLAILPAMKTHG
jgi:co-chaperonin GroES (HSP10)